MKRLALALSLVMTIVVARPHVGSAQVAVFTAGEYDSVQKQWYRYQQYLNESQTALNEYNQFQQAYTNYTKYKIGGLVQVLTPLTALQTTINQAMSSGQNPALAAELKRNAFVLQNVSLIEQLKNMNENGSVTTSQMMQTSNEILSTLAADQLAQRQVDYAKAQAAIQKQNNLAAYGAATTSIRFSP